MNVKDVKLIGRWELLGVCVLLGVLLLTACCPPDMIRGEAIRPSVDAVTTRFDALLDQAVEAKLVGEAEAEVWRGESALLRAVVGEDPDAALPLPR